MATAEDRLKVLKMVAAGQITAEEAEQWLTALGEQGPSANAAGLADEARWFRVCVTDTASGKAKVNVKLPLGLLDVGPRAGARCESEADELSLGRALKAIKPGAPGKLVDVLDDTDGDHVEVFVE